MTDWSVIIKGGGMKKTAILLLSTFFLAGYAHGDPSATAIVSKADELLRGESSEASFEMTVTTPSWARTMKGESWSTGRWNKGFIHISSPARDEGSASLKIGNEMWNYIPKVERITKIPPSLILQGWMGSDFTNDDLMKESSLVNDYTHKLVSSEKDAWTVELEPKPEAAVVWGKLVMRIRKPDFVPLIEEFYDEHLKKVRVLTFSDIQDTGDRNYPLTWEMVSVIKDGHKTILKYHGIKFNIPVDDNRFSLKNLQKMR